MKTISNAFASLVEASAGRFVTISFITKAGHLKSMNCRTGVTKALKGGKCTTDLSKYIVVYDMQAQGYRSINRNTIVSISAERQRAVTY
jgi:hypothetical protein